MLIITTENPGRNYKPLCAVVEYAVVGLNAVKDFMAGIADFTGGRVVGYEKAGKDVIENLLKNMERAAEKKQADAIVGLNVMIMPMNSKGTSMMSITLTGTAIKYVEAGASSMQWRDINNGASSSVFAEPKDDNTQREPKSGQRKVIYNKPSNY